MGASALVVSTILSAASAVHSSSVQRKALKIQQAEQTKQIEAQARTAETELLRQRSQAIAANIARSAKGGLAFEGTPALLTEGVIKQSKEDEATLAGMASGQISALQAGTKAQLSANTAQLVGSLAQIGASAATQGSSLRAAQNFAKTPGVQ